MEAALQMPDQLWMLEQEIEFHQGLSGWNKTMDNIVFSNRAQTYEKAPQESLFFGTAVAREHGLGLRTKQQVSVKYFVYLRKKICCTYLWEKGDGRCCARKI